MPFNCVFSLGTGYFGLYFISRSGLFKSIFISSGTVHLNCVFSLGTGYFGLYFTSRSGLFKTIKVYLYRQGRCLGTIFHRL